MKNLKRLLCLALTGVMLSGMMVMGASAADFTDNDDIVNVEAVDTMVALNIINGKDDGSFDPNGLVTRAEMAKMIATAVNGGVAPEFGVKATPSYTDIKGHWAEQYIEYCSDMKYINGRGDGTFDPAGNVTGTEAAKMVLTALGYEARAYQLTGADWAINTNALAGRDTKPALYEDLQGTNMNVAISRDVAARIIWNGLQNKVVEYDPNVTITGTDITYGYKKGDDTLLKKAYDADIWVGTFYGNHNTHSSSISTGEIGVLGGLEGTSSSINARFPYDFDIANIGEEVKVIYKENKVTARKNQPDAKDVIYGVFLTGASSVITTTRDKVAEYKSDDQAIKLDGIVYEVANSVTVHTNFNTQATYTRAWTEIVDEDDPTQNVAHPEQLRGVDKVSASVLTNALRGNPTTSAANNVNGDTIKAITNPLTGKVETIYITESKLATVTAVNSTKISMNNGVGTIEVAKNDVEDDLKKGDVVVATILYAGSTTSDDAYTIVKKAESVTGNVDGWKTTESVTLDGTTYKIYNKDLKTTSAIPSDGSVDGVRIATFKDTANTYIGKDVTLYLCNGYVWAAMLVSEDANNYSLITEVKNGSTSGSTFDGLQLQVMAADGTKSIITVSKYSSTDNTRKTGGANDVDTKAITYEDYWVGDIITYTINSAGEAEVKVEGQVSSTTAAYNDKNTSITKGGTTTLTDENCVLFVQTDESVLMGDGTNGKQKVNGTFKAYNVRDLKSIASGTRAITTVIDNNTKKVVAAFINTAEGKNPAGATTNTVFGIISKVGNRVKDYYEYTVQSNGEEYTVMSKDSNAVLSRGMLVTFDLSKDNNYAAGEIKPIYYGFKVSSTAGNVTDGSVQTGWTKEAEASTISFWTSMAQGDRDATPAVSYVGSTYKTYAMADNVQIIYVDLDNAASTGVGAIGDFDSVTGYKNILLVMDEIDSEDTIVAAFVETSNTCDIKPVAGVAPNASTADIQAAPDGMYIPKDLTWDTNGWMAGVTAANTRLFKWTATTGSSEYTLTIQKKGDGDAVTKVYQDETAAINDTNGHFIMMGVAPLCCGTNDAFYNDWAATGTNADTAAAPATVTEPIEGNYVWYITKTAKTGADAAITAGIASTATSAQQAVIVASGSFSL